MTDSTDMEGSAFPRQPSTRTAHPEIRAQVAEHGAPASAGQRLGNHEGKVLLMPWGRGPKPIEGHIFGSSPTRLFEDRLRLDRGRLTEHILPPCLSSAPAWAAAQPPQNFRPADRSFVDHLAILGFKHKPARIVEREVLQRATDEKSLFIEPGDSRESAEWHEERLKKIDEAVRFLLERRPSESDVERRRRLAQFFERRSRFLADRAEWEGRTLELPMFGYPYTRETVSCAGHGCIAPCHDALSRVKGKIKAENFPGHGDAVERGCAVGVYKHDALRAQRVVYASFANGNILFHVGKYTVCGDICQSTGESTKISRDHILFYETFPCGVTTRKEVQKVFETLQRKGALHQAGRTFQDFEAELSIDAFADIEAFKRRFLDAMQLLCPLVARSWDETTALPSFQYPEDFTTHPMGVACQNTSGAHRIVEVGVTSPGFRPASAEEAQMFKNLEEAESVAMLSEPTRANTARHACDSGKHRLSKHAISCADEGAPPIEKHPHPVGNSPLQPGKRRQRSIGGTVAVRDSETESEGGF